MMSFFVYIKEKFTTMEISYNLKIKASPNKVYEALSTHAGISSWWCKDCSVGESEGQDSHLRFNKEGSIVEMGFVTTHLNKDKKVLWECNQNPNPAWIGTRVSSEITPTAGGCELLFSHRNFDEKWKGQEAFEMTKGGWDHFVKSLVSFCEGGDGEPW